MSANKKSRSIPSQGGLYNNIVLRIKLIMRLMGDRRVNFLLKLIPVGSLVYFLVPDLVIGPVDDALIIWLSTVLFVEMCPPEIVQEHLAILNNVVPGQWEEPDPSSSTGDPNQVIDANYWDEDQ
jgi:hypothetical protein